MKRKAPSDDSTAGPSGADLMANLRMLFRPNPWHGISMGPDAPAVAQAYVECAPGEQIKYEVDKETGYLIVDRPHKHSSVLPALYGFFPRTYCGSRCAARAMERNPALKDIHGDGDPLDVLIVSSRSVQHGDILVRCRPVAGFRMIGELPPSHRRVCSHSPAADGGEADDKIIAVIVGDPLIHWQDLGDIPPAQLALLKHYFVSYKQAPDGKSVPVSIPETYDKAEALNVIRLSEGDYSDKFGDPLAAAERALQAAAGLK